MTMLNLPTKPMPACDGRNPIAKPSKESSLRKKAAKREEVADLKRAIDGKGKPKRKPIPPKTRAMVLERDGRRCVICGKSVRDKHANGAPVLLEVDHIVPVAAGGTNCESNLRTACNVCNVGRGARRDPD
jgi:5-methylcytosine-specific restriction endonuclease McrA